MTRHDGHFRTTRRPIPAVTFRFRYATIISAHASRLRRLRRLLRLMNAAIQSVQCQTSLKRRHPAHQRRNSVGSRHNVSNLHSRNGCPTQEKFSTSFRRLMTSSWASIAVASFSSAAQLLCFGFQIDWPTASHDGFRADIARKTRPSHNFVLPCRGIFLSQKLAVNSVGQTRFDHNVVLGNTGIVPVAQGHVQPFLPIARQRLQEPICATSEAKLNMAHPPFARTFCK